MELLNRRALVTGGAGFIGSHLADRLLQLGARVSVIDDLSFGKAGNINRQADFMKVDITDYDKLEQAILGINPDIVYHFAADATTKESSMGWNDPLRDFQVNAVGTLNILRTLARCGTQPLIIFASSAAVYGEPEYTPVDEKHANNPVSPYGISKLAGEKYVLAYIREHLVNGIVVRIFPVYGPRQPRYVMYDILEKLARDHQRLEVMGTGEQIRDYNYIDDFVDAAVLLTETDNAFGKVFNISGSNAISIRHLVELIIRTLELQDITKVSYTGKSWKGDVRAMDADITKIRELGFSPKTSLEEGIQKLNNWFKENSAQVGNSII